MTGKFAEARQAIAQAQEADAFLLSEPRILHWQILADLNLGRYADARQTCAQGVRWYPLDATFLTCQSQILGWTAADVKSARRVWQVGKQAEDAAPPAWRSDIYRTKLLFTAAILARTGYRDSAKSLLSIFAATRRQPGDLDGFASDEAYVRLLVGQKDEALALLKTFLHHNWAQRGHIMRTPWYRTLHGDSTFVAITRQRP